jgi:hypothetical protein
MPARRHSNTISLICPAVREKLAQEHDALDVIEFSPFCKLVNFVIPEMSGTFSELATNLKNLPDLKT